MVSEEKQKQKYRTQWVNGSLQVVIRMEKVLIRERYCVLVLARGMNFKGHWLKNCWNLAPLYRFKASDFFAMLTKQCQYWSNWEKCLILSNKIKFYKSSVNTGSRAE